MNNISSSLSALILRSMYSSATEVHLYINDFWSTSEKWSRARPANVIWKDKRIERMKHWQLEKCDNRMEVDQSTQSRVHIRVHILQYL